MYYNELAGHMDGVTHDDSHLYHFMLRTVAMNY